MALIGQVALEKNFENGGLIHVYGKGQTTPWLRKCSLIHLFCQISTLLQVFPIK